MALDQALGLDTTLKRGAELESSMRQSSISHAKNAMSATVTSLSQSSVGAAMVGFFLLAFLGVALVSLGLGIGGLLQKKRKKIFAILGTVFSSVSLVSTIFLMILGLAME